MVVLEHSWRLPNSQSSSSSTTLLLPRVSASFCTKFSPPLPSSLSSRRNLLFLSSSSPEAKNSTQKVKNGGPVKFPYPNSKKSEAIASEEEEEEEGIQNRGGNLTIILSSCIVGLLTGVGVVLFNNGVNPICYFAFLAYVFCRNYHVILCCLFIVFEFLYGKVHEVRDLFWDGIPNRGASWLREEPIEDIWKRVILVPTCGGLIVSVLNVLISAVDDDNSEKNGGPLAAMGLPISIFDGFKAASRPFLKAVAACVTLGTGNSLGPEGPSVEIGTSIAKGVGFLFNRNSNRKTSLVAAGSSAGIASGLYLSRFESICNVDIYSWLGCF